MRRVRWGVLGVAKIAVTKVIPAMQRGQCCEVVAIASRDHDKAEQAALRLGIPKAFGSYEELLADPEIEAIYNPLPNHLHVPWSIRAAEAGKHVLCEKPVAMNAAEARALMAARDRTGVTVGEAFTVQTHPVWLRILELVRGGRIGQLRAALGTFYYFNADPANVRNIREYGGGSLMDIGCYAIKTSRMVFAEEPARVSAALVRDARLTGVDVLATAILEYPSGHCAFSCGMQAAANQSMCFFGTTGCIEPEGSFNPPPDRPARILIDGGATVEELAPADGYSIQGDEFSKAVRAGGPPPVPLEDSVRNMAAIDALFRSAETGKWEEPAPFRD